MLERPRIALPVRTGFILGATEFCPDDSRDGSLVASLYLLVIMVSSSTDQGGVKFQSPQHQAK